MLVIFLNGFEAGGYQASLWSIALLLGIQLTAAGIVLLTASQTLFLGGVFFLGMTTSALQFIAIATLADAYPVTGSRKIATVTGMYATGALVSPLAVDFYLRHGLAWRTLFGLLLAGSLLSLVGGAVYPCVLTLLLPFAGKRTATATRKRETRPQGLDK